MNLIEIHCNRFVSLQQTSKYSRSPSFLTIISRSL